MSSVVLSDVPPNVSVAGVPSRVAKLKDKTLLS